jgi:hypothetical protein
MFFSEACAARVLKTVLPDVTLSSMGLLELNNRTLELFDKITGLFRKKDDPAKDVGVAGGI